MRIHDLKIQRKHFIDVESGHKRAEIRKHDRDFKVGEFLRLNEIDEHGTATGEGLIVLITHILPGGDFGLDAEYSILSIGRIARTRVMDINLSPRPDFVGFDPASNMSEEERTCVKKILRESRQRQSIFIAENNIRIIPHQDKGAAVYYRGFTADQMLEYIRGRGLTVEVTIEMDIEGSDIWRVALSGRKYESFDGTTLFRAAKDAFERFADDAVRERKEAQAALNKIMRLARKPNHPDHELCSVCCGYGHTEAGDICESCDGSGRDEVAQ